MVEGLQILKKKEIEKRNRVDYYKLTTDFFCICLSTFSAFGFFFFFFFEFQSVNICCYYYLYIIFSAFFQEDKKATIIQ